MGMLVSKEDRIKELEDFLSKYSAKNLVIISELDKIGFFTAPASTKYHGAYEGGLFDHSLEVAKQLIKLTDKLGLKWVSPISPIVIGLFHDLCKCDNYVEINTLEEVAPISVKYKINPDIIIPGHGEKSVIMAQKFLFLTDEEIACIRWHMGAYETDPKMWDYYGRAIERFPNVLYTHTADMIASKIVGV